MKRTYFFWILANLIAFSTATSQSVQPSSCIFQFVENGSMVNFSKLINLKSLIGVNEKKDFYIASISVQLGKEIKIKVNECSNLENKLLLFDGTVKDFDLSSFTIDTTFLFKKVGDEKVVTFESHFATGGSYHANTNILVFKYFDKIFYGYSIDGCDLLVSMKELIQKYFTFDEDIYKSQLLSVFNSLP